jgi:N-acetyl-gamma-glutamyl-phosphate reductase
VPVRGDFARGIFASMYVASALSREQALKLYQDYYSDAPFVVVTDANVSLKEVVNTNKCFIQLQKHGSKLLIGSVIDNLLKGASGQAVQNMNLVFGLDEKEGLRLKPSRF